MQRVWLGARVTAEQEAKVMSAVTLACGLLRPSHDPKAKEALSLLKAVRDMPDLKREKLTRKARLLDALESQLQMDLSRSRRSKPDPEELVEGCKLNGETTVRLCLKRQEANEGEWKVGSEVDIGFMVRRGGGGKSSTPKKRGRSFEHVVCAHCPVGAAVRKAAR